MTDQQLCQMWLDAGGKFHGPNVETGTMPQSLLLPFLRGLVKFAKHDETECDKWSCDESGWSFDDAKKCTCGLDAALKETK